MNGRAAGDPRPNDLDENQKGEKGRQELAVLFQRTSENMEFELTEEQRMLVQALRDVLTKEFPKEYFRQHDANGEWPTELVKKLGELGYLGIPVPVEYGGSGGNMLDVALVQNTLSRAIGGSGLFYILSTSFGAKTLASFGSEEQKKELLPKLARGDITFSMALTEPSGGTDILAMQTKAVHDGNQHFVINGQKTFISGAHVADWLIAVARTGDYPEKKAKGFTVFLVDPKSKGIEMSRINITCQRTTGANDIFFTDVMVPEKNVIGEVHRGFYQLFATLNNERIASAAHYIGVAEGVFDIALQWAKDREAFGGPIGRFQAIQHMLADAYIKIEAANNYIFKAAWMEAEGMQGDVEATACLYLATNAAVQVSGACFRVMGGYAVCEEYDISRYMRDAVVGVNGPISNEMCLNHVGESLGLPRSY